METQREKARLRLLKKYGKILSDIKQLANDAEWWNEHRADAPPFDVGGDKVAIALIRVIIEHLERDENIPDQLVDRLSQQMEAIAAI